MSLCTAAGQSARRGAGRAVEFDGDGAVAIHDQSGHRARVAAGRGLDARRRAQHRAAKRAYAGAAAPSDGALNDGDRGAIATQLQSSARPVDDARQLDRRAGNFLFSGFQSSAQPYTTEVERRRRDYSGDTGTRSRADHRLAPGATGDNGVAVFMSVAPVGCGSGRRRQLGQHRYGRDRHGERERSDQRDERRHVFDRVQRRRRVARP